MPSAPTIASDAALRIAREDAERAYGDLSPYRISVLLCNDGWHVDYEPADRGMNGGGPHYVIDSASGEICSKRYEQ